MKIVENALPVIPKHNTPSEKTRIDFFVPGFSKCGTTTLFAVLNHHPDIFIPDYKEPQYFGSAPEEKRTAWFDSLYEKAASHQIKGDCTTFYSSIFMETRASCEMFENNPKAKLIFIARDPLDRIESSFREMHNSAPKFGLDTPFQLEDALVEMPQLLEDTAYYSRMQTHRERFGKDNILVIFMEDLKTDAQAVASRCYEFLGVGKHKFEKDDLPHLNRGGEKLYDTKLFRWMRNNPIIGPPLSWVSINNQDSVAKKLGLRRPFTKPIHWSESAKTLVKNRLAQEIGRFLEEFGKTAGCWPRFHALCQPTHRSRG